MTQSFHRGTETGKVLLANWGNRLMMLPHIISAVGKISSIVSTESRTDFV